MPRLLCAGVLVVACLAVGCSKPHTSIGRTDRSPDTLRAENARLRAQNRALRDSLQFRRDIGSGQYSRKMRTLEDHLARLTYELRLLRQGGITVRVLSTDSLFEPASTTLRPEGEDSLRALAQQLERTYPNRQVRVEGHTDDRPLSDSLQEQFATNWELSTGRATTVVRMLLEMTSLAPRQFAAVGYGSSRPRASNETPAGRRRNRRVRVGVLPVPREYTQPYQTRW